MEVLTHTTTEMNFENITLRERDQYKGPYIVGFHLYEMSRIGKSKETENRLVVTRD